MLVTQPKKRIVQKILRTETGEFIRATFLVVEWQGQIRGRLISTEAVPAHNLDERRTPALPYVCEKEVSDFTYTPNLHDIVSPYSTHSFFVSQPTRAPSLA